MGYRRISLVLWGVLLTGGPAFGIVWFGPESTTGPVEVPSSYLEAVESFAMRRFNFDALGAGTNVTLCNLGGFMLSAQPPESVIIAETGLPAGVEPSSSPNALLMSGPITDSTGLTIELFQPVASLGFVLMGLDCPSRLKVHGASGSVIGDYQLPAGGDTERRWFAVLEYGALIRRLQLQPASPGDYAIDDLELGTHAPEPATLFLLLAGTMAFSSPRPCDRHRRLTRHRSNRAVGRPGIHPRA